MNATAKGDFLLLRKPKIRVIKHAKILSQMTVIVVLLKRIGRFVLRITLQFRNEMLNNKAYPPAPTSPLQRCPSSSGTSSKENSSNSSDPLQFFLPTTRECGGISFQFSRLTKMLCSCPPHTRSKTPRHYLKARLLILRLHSTPGCPRQQKPS